MRELQELRPWLDAGVGVRVDAYAEPLFTRKHYLIPIGDGYALTQPARDRAAQLLSGRRQPDLLLSPERGGRIVTRSRDEQ
jgi:hypothetical protein